jgi:CspA family cold shock protein
METKKTQTLETTNEPNYSPIRVLGRVKWFNNTSGYGFITFITKDEKNDTDIFVHHSSIHISGQHYKYLVQGEYVEFSVEATQNGTHTIQAVHITGIHNGKLMCETRFLNKTYERDEVVETHNSTQITDKQPQRPQKSKPVQDKKKFSSLKSVSKYIDFSEKEGVSVAVGVSAS